MANRSRQKSRLLPAATKLMSEKSASATFFHKKAGASIKSKRPLTLAGECLHQVDGGGIVIFRKRGAVA
jgi:hypothetical protein